MTDQETKCVIIADEALPAGMLANTTAILGITLGKQVPECVGQDVSGMIVVDFSDVAQGCNSYDEYMHRAASPC